MTSVVLQSESGDYIGGGIPQTLNPPTWQYNVYGGTDSVRLYLNGPSFWNFDIVAPEGTLLKAGMRYDGGGRAPFRSPKRPGLDVSGDGRGCNTLTGWFEVLEYTLDNNGNPAKVAINFKQNCEGATPSLFGAIRINSSLAATIPGLRAVAGPTFEKIAGESALLDGRGSFTRSGGTLSYAWKQISGPTVTLDDPASELPAFTAPAVASGGQTLVFSLTVKDSATGHTDTDRVPVVVRNADDPQTFVRFSGPSTDYISAGHGYDFNRTDSDLNFNGNYDGGVSSFINGDSFWTLDFAPPSGVPFTTGAYENSQRFPFQDSAHPGLDVSGDGRGCNTSTGRFDVRLAEFDSSGNPSALAIDFEQHCEGASPALTGQLRFNAPLTPPTVSWVTPTPADGAVINLTATLPFSQTVRAAASSARDGVHISSITVPAGATLTESDGNPSSATLRWTPSRPGNTLVTFLAADTRYHSVSAPPRSFTLHVVKRATALVANAEFLQVQPLQVHIKMSAVLDALGPTVPLAGKTVDFLSAGRVLCSATTDANGAATCGTVLTAIDTIETLGYSASFSGDAVYLPSSAKGALIKLK